MADLKQAIKQKARQLGFILTGVTSSEPPAHYAFFRSWLDNGYHGAMQYLQNEKRADPKLILPECKSILVLAIPYLKKDLTGSLREKPVRSEFQIASFALGDDYHEVIPPKLKQIVQFIEEQLGHKIPNRYYTDTGPILERELAQRAGLGWVGKNSMLINPKVGSTFFLAEILLGIDPSTGSGLDLKSDDPFITDHCGTCTRCIHACPTHCILPNRTLDAQRCISYLTIENKDEIPEDLRPLMQKWVFGCDVCQQVCPWNRFSAPADSSFTPNDASPLPADMLLTLIEFNQRFKKSPIRRAKHRGYLRNLAVAIGNVGNQNDLPILEQALHDGEPLVKEHVQWAKGRVNDRINEAIR